MKPIGVYILEDNHQTKQRLIEFISRRPEFRVIGSSDTGEKALAELSNEECDLLLLDIHLPDMSGIDVLDQLKKIPHLIFITAYDQYAVKAFDMGAVDYLLKPFPKERFDKSIERFLAMDKEKIERLSSAKDLGFSFKDKNEHYLFAYDDIRFFSSKGKHTIMHTAYRDFTLAKLIKNVAEQLPAKLFLRIHKQFMVNIRHVSRLEHLCSGHYLIHLKGDDLEYLPVGRAYLVGVKELFEM